MTSTPKTHSRISSGTTTYGVRNRSRSRLATTKPTAPPACWRSEESPSSGWGLPLAIWTMPSTPKASATQPTTCRPAGPLRSGSRMLRHPIRTSISGTNQPTFPTEPETTVRADSMTVPGSCHHTAAAATTARPMRKRPMPSRRCSGSRSRAPRPILRASAPTAWARPSQRAATPRPSARKARDTGPGPFRTARGAGRRVREGARLLDDRRRLVGAGLRVVPRDRVLEPAPPDRRDRPEEDVLLLREPGGEDVRVAMTPNVCHRHSSHTDHRAVSARCPRGPGCPATTHSGASRPRQTSPADVPADVPGRRSRARRTADGGPPGAIRRSPGRLR